MIIFKHFSIPIAFYWKLTINQLISSWLINVRKRFVFSKSFELIFTSHFVIVSGFLLKVSRMNFVQNTRSLRVGKIKEIYGRHYILIFECYQKFSKVFLFQIIEEQNALILCLPDNLTILNKNSRPSTR